MFIIQDLRRVPRSTEFGSMVADWLFTSVAAEARASRSEDSIVTKQDVQCNERRQRRD